MRRSAWAFAAAITIALSLAACGGSESPEPAGDYGSFFGVAPQETPNEADFARMAAGGIGSYHLLISWGSVEAAEGSYDWSSYDQVVGELARNGIEPVPFVFGTPRFYADDPSEPPTTSEDALAAWARFLRAAAARYGSDGAFWQDFAESDPEVEPRPLRTWEIWNEPNSSLFWQPRPDPSDYGELLRRSATALRGVDPEAEIMSAGMFVTPASDNAIESYDFLEQLLAEDGVLDAVDVVGVHPYSPRVGGKLGVIDQVEQTRATIEAAGEDADLWVTEIGWGSDPRVPNDLAKSPEGQAELLTESLGGLADDRERLGLRGVLWFSWHDSEANEDCGWCATSGLVDADRDSKPAWLAFTDLTGGEP